MPDSNLDIFDKKEAPVIMKTILNFIKNNQSSPKMHQINLLVEDIDYELYEKMFLEKCREFYFSYPTGTRFMILDGGVFQLINPNTIVQLTNQ